MKQNKTARALPRPSKAIPKLDRMYDAVKAFVRKHQGKKGYIETQNADCDTIYTLVYSEDIFDAMEMRVHGVRVNPANDELEIIYDNDTHYPYRIKYGHEDFVSPEAEWESVKDSDIVYFIPTIFDIAQFIEEYVKK